MAMLAVVLLIVGCSATPPPTPAADGALGELMAEPFGQTTIDAAVEVLAKSGIATYEQPDSTEPLIAASEPALPFKLLADQARAMALEANVGGGIEGAELDALIDTPADLAPPSYILAGYVAAADTEGAAAARTLMGVADWGPEEWRQAPFVNFPQLVLVLFTADVAREQTTNASARQPLIKPQAARDGLFLDVSLPVRGAAVAQVDGPCSAVSNFITSSLRSVFDALRLGEPSSGVGSVLVKIWNFVVSILETIVTAIVREFKQVVLDQIAKVAAIVGTLSLVISLVRPWTVSVRSATTEKGIAGISHGEQGQLTAQVELGDLDEWPPWAENCARESGRPLPNLKPEGAPVTWQTLIQNPPRLVEEGLRREALDSNGAAYLDFTTLIDEVETPYETYPGAIYSRVTIERPSLGTLLNMVETQIWSGLPSIVVGPLQSFLGESIEKVKSSLSRLLTVHASGPAVVLFHVQQATPEPVTPRPVTNPTSTARPQTRRPAMSNGDPHIVTVDDTAYDFQAAGEFVLLRSADGAFELQARQEPAPQSDSVSVNTALAMKAGTSRIGIQLTPDALGVLATVDGAEIDTSQPQEVNGTRIAAEPAGLVVTFPGGTRLFVFGQIGIQVTLDPSDALRASGMGLMGRVAPEGMGLPALPDGTLLPSPAGLDEYHAGLYGAFADAWRLTAEQSLFDYEPGTSTETFTLRDFPAEFLSLADLTAEQRAIGEARCAGIDNAVLHDQCVFDVGITGNSDFVGAYDVSANIIETGSFQPSGRWVDSGSIGPPFPDQLSDQVVYDHADIFSSEVEYTAGEHIAYTSLLGGEVVVYTQFNANATTESTARDAVALMDQWGIPHDGFDFGLVVFFNVGRSQCVPQMSGNGHVHVYGGPDDKTGLFTTEELQSIVDGDVNPRLMECDLDTALLAALTKIQGAAIEAH